MSNQQLTVFKERLLSDPAQQGLASQLPDDVDIDKFTAVVIRAVQEDPQLLQADSRSLFLSCQRAAQDGLIPDKREGALVVYNQKVNDQWVKKVQWQPMIAGLRKRLANHGFDIRAELIYENDSFDYELGDEPSLSHKPAPLGQPRGALIGAYAIATGPDGRMYREVMDIDALNYVKSLSKASGGPWSKFEGEMHRKTPAKRLFKYLPLPDDDTRLQGLIDRDNEQFDLGEASTAARDIQAEVRKPAKKASTSLPKPKKAPSLDDLPAEEVTDNPPAEEAKPKKKKASKKKKATKKKDEPKPPESEPIEGELVDEGDDQPLF